MQCPVVLGDADGKIRALDDSVLYAHKTVILPLCNNPRVQTIRDHDTLAATSSLPHRHSPLPVQRDLETGGL
jgi:hypothetical protein